MSDRMGTPLFSLVLATVDRTDTLKRFLDSLQAQERDDVQLIVVDQNDDDRLAPLLAEHGARTPIEHLRSPRGVSRARNVGLARASGRILAFPDDDCWYPLGLLAKVHDLLVRDNLEGLTGRVVDEQGRPAVVRWGKHQAFLTPKTVWRQACSVSMFLRAELVRRTGDFDENFGIGATWGGSEETDYLLRAIAAGGRIQYRPDVAVGHPNPTASHDATALWRARSYGMGIGRVMAKHALPLRLKAGMCLRPLGGVLVGLASLNVAKARFHWAACRGRLAGWLSRKR